MTIPESLTVYLPFDQDKHLPPPPWKPTLPALIAWEKGHGHDVRLKCYPEFGCQALDNAFDMLTRDARTLYEALKGLHLIGDDARLAHEQLGRTLERLDECY